MENRPIQWPFLRLAEIYLSYAEALNEYNGSPNAQAYDAVDKVRARVNLPGLKKDWGKKNFVKLYCVNVLVSSVTKKFVSLI